MCFAVPHADTVVGDKLCDWLPHCFDEIACKRRVTLGPLLASVDAQVASIARYRDELDDSDVGCHVDATRAPAGTFAAFHAKLGRAIDGAPHRLVLLATVRPGTECPPGVTALPEPRLHRDDVITWAGRVLADHNVPPRHSRRWIASICDYALDSGDVLDPRRAYEAMEDGVRRLLTDSADFIRSLAQGSLHA
jgi:hypothetical protein